MPHATINGVELFYDDHGSGDPLLIHHGYTGSHYSWDAVLPSLAKQHRVIRMDCRGAGDSGRPDNGHTIEQYAADAVAMMEHLGIPRFTYIGHSMGGVIGYELGLSYPDRLDKLVLVTPAPADGVQVPPTLRERSTRLRRENDVATLVREGTILSARETSDEVEVRVRRGLSVSDAHFEQSWDALVNYRKGDRLGEIKTPTLMIVGAADALMPANLADFPRLGNATLHVFSRVSHGVPYEVPEQFAAIVLDFLEHGVVTSATLQAKLREAAAPAR
jgi:pimeloyl-ACP methyl ester carboxylesterase